MIKHIVFWNLKEQAEGSGKAQNMEKIKALLEKLPDTIPEIRAFEVGINYNDSEAAFEVALYSAFDNKQDLATYQNHPEHKKAAEFIGKVCAQRAVVDYEI